VEPVEHARHTREVYDRLAPVWSATTDDGPFNGLLERPALRSLVPRPLKGRAVLDVGCGSGAQCAWLLDEGANVTGVDLSPVMIEQARRRCGSRANLLVADMAEPLPLESRSFDGVTCSLALHYLRDWQVPLASFARVLRPGGWAVISLDHPFGAPLPDQSDGYFQCQLVSDTWNKADVEVTQYFWRRPLAQVVDAFAEAGFVVERIVEPQPSREAMLRYPTALQNVVDSPSFIVYRLRYSGDPE
jgi:ubiquinone/menaquinone biosynthesis C-methylase UbiE